MPESFAVHIPNSEIDRTYIYNVWRMESELEGDMHGLVMPNGTAEIIFNFSDPIEYAVDNKTKNNFLPAVFLSGMRLNPIRNKIVGRQYLLGIQFNCIALKIMFGYSAKEFTNKIYDGRLIDKSLNELNEKLYDQNDFKQQAETLILWFRKKVEKNGCQLAMNEMQKIVIAQRGIDLTVKKLSDQIFVSPRQMQRQTNEWLGMCPDDFLMYHKFLHSTTLIQREDLSLSEVALQSGYYDQSHYIKEFKNYTHMTPGQYRSMLFEKKVGIC